MVTNVKDSSSITKQLLTTAAAEATAEATAEKWLKLLGKLIKPMMCCRVTKPSSGSWQLLMLHACTL